VQQESCDPKPFEASVHALDPGNGAAWIGSIERAAKAGDSSAVQAYMLEIGKSERFDTYWNTNIAHLANALVRTGKVGAYDAVVQVTGILAAFAIPAYKDVSTACKGDVLRQQDVLENCRKVAASMGRGDTYIAEMIGVAIAKRVWPEDSVEYRAAVEARRVARYRMSIDLKADTSNNDAARYLELYATNRREQEVFVARLVAAGFAPDPPAGWTESR
jgi:hypothetical protein